MGVRPISSLSWLMLSLLTVPGNRQTNHGSQHASSNAPNQTGAGPGSGNRPPPFSPDADSASSKSRMAEKINSAYPTRTSAVHDSRLVAISAVPTAAKLCPSTTTAASKAASTPSLAGANGRRSLSSAPYSAHAAPAASAHRAVPDSTGPSSAGRVSCASASTVMAHIAARTSCFFQSSRLCMAVPPLFASRAIIAAFPASVKPGKTARESLTGPVADDRL